MWNRLRFIRFLQVSQIFQRRKSDANKQDFENKFNLTCHAQSPPKTTGILTKIFCTSGPNLVALAWTGDELSRGQAQNRVNFDFEVKFDLEGQGQSPPKTIGILTKVFYIYGPNLVILADTGHELSRGQARDWHTDGHTHTQTDAGNDNTRRPILASGKKQNIYWCYHFCMTISMQHIFQIIQKTDKISWYDKNHKQILWLMIKNILMQIIRKKKKKQLCK